jgi:PKD domain-containing protein
VRRTLFIAVVGLVVVATQLSPTAGVSLVESTAIGLATPLSSDEIVVDFGTLGLWTLFDGNTATWSRLHPLTARNIVTGDLDGNGISEVIIDFGATGVWVWANNSGWFQLHAASTTRMATGDLDGNGKADVLLEFQGLGIWVWSNNTSWSRLHPSASNNIVTADLDGNGKKEAIVDFPAYGLWVWSNNTSWYQLHSKNTRLMTTGDFDGNGKADLIVDFAGYGLWGYSNNSSWSQVHPLNATHLAAGDIDGGGRSDLIVDFGNPNGIWKLLNGTAWSQINTLTSSNLTTADLDGNGKADVIVSFGAAGLWEYVDNTSWVRLHGVGPGLIAVGHLNGIGPNRPPVITGVTVSPLGIGVQSATNFTFAGQGVSDPDGDPLTYAWTSSDGTAITFSGPTAAHVFGVSGTFDVRVTVTDSKGLSAAAVVSVKVGSLTGVWDVSCNPHPAYVDELYPAFPKQFVVTLTQTGTSLTGTMSGAGHSAVFPSPGAGAADTVSNPRKVNLGVEGRYNVWAPGDGDNYFHLAADDTLTSMSGSGQYCISSVAHRR